MKRTLRKVMRSRRHMWLAILGPTGVFVVIAAVVLGVAVIGVLGMPDPSTTNSSSCGGTPGSGVVVPVTGSAPNLTPEQLHNAQVITGVALGLGLGRPGVLVGVLTADVEADLINVGFGDTMSNGQMSSSRGLYQQLSDWGPLADRLDPAKATKMFFTGGGMGQPGLMQIPGWQTMDPGSAMQAVQGSQFAGGTSPGYAAKLAHAQAITTALTVGQPAAPAVRPAAATAPAGTVVPLPLAPVVGGVGCPAVVAAGAAHASVPAGSFVSFTQWDPNSAWHSLPYWGSTIGNAGCGPTSVAEVAATWKDKSITPDKVASYITSIGGEGQGDLFPAIFQHYGLKAVGLSTMDQAVAGLKAGGIVIISASGSSPFTSEGHFVVLRAINPDGRIELGDVNAPKGERTNAHSWSVGELTGAMDDTGIHSLNLITNASPA